MYLGGVIMPMCRSPKIADFLLRTDTAASNDNDGPVDKPSRPLQSQRHFKAPWQIPVSLFCIIVFLVLKLSGPF